MKILTFLGSDSGFGDKNNSSYVEEENKLILIDCGFTVFNEIKRKFDFNKFDNIEVVITHLHNDHAGSLSQLILYLYFIYNKKVTVISKCNNIKQYLDITGTPPEAYELKDELENLKFVKTEHTKYLDAYGFVLNVKNKKIVYTGDTNTLEPFLPFISIADELYVDVSRYGGAHLKIDNVIDLLKEFKSNGTEVVLMHIDDKKYIESEIKNKLEMA